MVSKTVKRAEKYFGHKFVGQNYVGQKWRWKRIVLYVIMLDINLEKCVVGHKTFVAHSFVGHERVGMKNVGHRCVG